MRSICARPPFLPSNFCFLVFLPSPTPPQRRRFAVYIHCHSFPELVAATLRRRLVLFPLRSETRADVNGGSSIAPASLPYLTSQRNSNKPALNSNLRFTL